MLTDRQLILDFLKANPGVKCSRSVQPAIVKYAFWSNAGSKVELEKRVNALHPKLLKRSECLVYPVEFSPGEVLEVT